MSTEVDEICDAIPEGNRRELLKWLAEFLRRLFDSRERRP